MMRGMMNKLQGYSNEDEAMRLRMEILNKLSPEEQQRVKRGFEPQMRRTSFYESQIQRKITEQNNNAIHIETGWDIGSAIGELQDEIKEDFLNESQYQQIRPLDKNCKKQKHMKHQRSQKKQRNNQAQIQFQNNNQALNSHLGQLLSQKSYPGRPGRAPDQSHTKLRSRQPTSRRQRIAPLTQINPQSQNTPNPNQNYSSNLNVELTRKFINPFSVPKGIKHQQIAGDAAQTHHASRETFPTNGNVRNEAPSKDSIVLGQEGVAGTKPINNQTVTSPQFQGNLICEPKVEKKIGKAHVRSKITSTNTSVVANQNQNEYQLR
ncbi:MAG: hypothetical protein EZS28_006933 [Streblomastix strix]|uniref:Uncharacterized protein n=1 Tax=Streblomastix strix TaxID=222440 RepID=A0A5J4WRH7_9EUKA|nr:MAG: hypothetical protein EZS28_006933 [Streblomastix strix]